MLQPEAEKAFQIILNAKLSGKGNPLPLRMEGFRGLGKTSQGLDFISSLMEERGWTVVESPFPTRSEIKEKQALAWLGKLCQSAIPTVIKWDEAENFPWACFKKLISSNGKPVEFQFSTGKESDTAVYNPGMFTWLLASNFSIDNGERGAGESRTVQVPFLPLNERDKLTLWKRLADAMGVKYSPETALIGARNALPIGRDLEKQVQALHDLSLEAGDLLNLSLEDDIREALAVSRYFPGGLQADHVKVLELLKEAPRKGNGDTYGFQLKDIRNRALDGRDETEIADSLAAGGFIFTTTGGRKGITEKGMEFLSNLEDYREERKESLARASLPLDKWKEARKAILSPVPVKTAKKATKPASKKGGRKS